MKPEIIKAITDAGCSVYMRNPEDTYAYFTDGVNIGYIQDTPLEGVTLGTRHVPNRASGTGFGLGPPKDLSAHSLKEAFISWPAWADADTRRSVRKYPTLGAFLSSNSWGGGLHLVAEPAKAG